MHTTWKKKRSGVEAFLTRRSDHMEVLKKFPIMLLTLPILELTRLVTGFCGSRIRAYPRHILLVWVCMSPCRGSAEVLICARLSGSLMAPSPLNWEQRERRNQGNNHIKDFAVGQGLGCWNGQELQKGSTILLAQRKS